MLKQILENLRDGEELVLDWYENAFSIAVDTALVFNRGVWELKQLNCVSANSQGLGTCWCNSHETYIYETISRRDALKYIKEYIQREEEEQREEDGTRPCVCGSGIHWAECPGDPASETPWEFCG